LKEKKTIHKLGVLFCPKVKFDRFVHSRWSPNHFFGGEILLVLHLTFGEKPWKNVFFSLKVIFLLVKIYHFTQLKKLKKRTTPQTFFVRKVYWQLSTIRLSQIWLHVIEESRIVF
jgi:hypothetical protein